MEGDQVKCNRFGGVISYPKNEVVKIEKEEFVATTVEQPAKSQGEEKLNPARESAEKAYHLAMSHAFSASVRQSALEELDKARSLDPEEAGIYLAEAIMLMQDGYKIGEWFKARSFTAGTVDRAIEKAKKAVETDPKYSKAHCVLAWFLIVKGDYAGADQALQIAYNLDKTSYYYWLYKGTLAIEKEELEKADEYFEIARQYATTKAEKSVIRSRKKYIAKASGDVEAQENYYIGEIERNPDSAHAYGNYATFLRCNGRFEESIEYYEKAISIAQYPAAVFGLQLAKLRQAAKCLNK